MLGIANIFRICGVLHIFITLGLSVSIFAGIWLPDGATIDHIGTGKVLVGLILSHGIGVGVLLILSSFITDVPSAKKILLGEIVLSICLLLAFIYNSFVLDSWYNGPPIVIWVVTAVLILLSIYGRLRVNRMQAINQSNFLSLPIQSKF